MENLVDGSMPSSNGFEESDTVGDDAALYEKFLLDDLDSYWDDLSVRLTVLRMVSDSVVKGIVNAVVDETSEKIASKEAELKVLSERLKCSESNSCRIGSSSMMPICLMANAKQHKTALKLHKKSLDRNFRSDPIDEKLTRLSTQVKNQFDRLIDVLGKLRSSNSGVYSDSDRGKRMVERFEVDENVGALRRKVEEVLDEIKCLFSSFGASQSDYFQLESELKNEVDGIVVQNYIKDLHDEFEGKLREQRNLIDSLSKERQKKISELSAIREELDAISRSLTNSERASLFSQNSEEVLEEWNGKRKDHVLLKVLADHSEENGAMAMKKLGESERTMLEVADSPRLKGMTKEEVMAYYKSEMIKMRRHHDLALQEKTEELFILKREFLKERGSPYFRKDKEFELLRKKIPELVLKLVGALQEEEKVPLLHDDQFSSLKQQIDTLYFENQHLRGLLTDKRKKVLHVSSQVSDVANQLIRHSAVETGHLEQIEKLKCEVRELKTAATIEDELFTIVLGDLISQLQCNVKDLEFETEIEQEIYSIILKGFADDTMSAFNSTLAIHLKENASVEQVLFEKDKIFGLVKKENHKLKQELASLSVQVEEKERRQQETSLALNEQKMRFDSVSLELSNRLNEALQQNDQYKVEISNLNQKIQMTSDALEDVMKQKNVLQTIILEKQNMLSSSVSVQEEQVKQMNSIITSVKDLSTAVAAFESRLANAIEQSESRLKMASNQWAPLVRHAGILKRKELWYKQMLEIRYANLQKAEAEVDLLGDEVDSLLSLLGKIYIALDHYSPVLQHYPGVMEILKLVHRELKAEKTK